METFLGWMPTVSTHWSYAPAQYPIDGGTDWDFPFSVSKQLIHCGVTASQTGSRLLKQDLVHVSPAEDFS